MVIAALQEQIVDHDPLEELEVRCMKCGALATLMVPGDRLVSDALKHTLCHRARCKGSWARAPRIG